MLAIIILFSAGCGGSNDNSAADESPLPTPNPNRVIRGNIFNTLDLQPVASATIQTSPGTQTTRSNLDGTYQIIDTGGTAGSVEYALRVAKAGYQPVEMRIAATAGENFFDIPLTPLNQRLVASPGTINIPFERNTATLFVNGSYASANFTVNSSVPWLDVTPTDSTINNSDAVRITMTVDRSALGDQLPVARLTVTADTGDSVTVVVDVETNSIEPPRDSAEVVTGLTPTFKPGQADCRRADILRLGNNDPNLSLVVFPQTAVLPGDEGRYLITQLPFLIYADSFQIDNRGTLRVRHTDGAGNTTLGTIFEIDLNGVLEILADDTDPVSFGRRTDLSATLDPGVYCYLLRPPGGIFTSFARFGLQVDFSAE